MCSLTKANNHFHIIDTFNLFYNLREWTLFFQGIEENKFYITCLSGILAGGVASLAVNPVDGMHHVI